MPFPSDSFNLRNPGQSGGGIFYVNRSRRRQQPSVQPQSQPSFQEAVGETANPVPPQDFDGTPTVAPMSEVGFGYRQKAQNRHFLPSPESLAISGVGAAIGAGALGFGAHASQAPSMTRLAGRIAGLNATAPTHGAIGSAAAGGFSKAGALQDAGGMFTGNSQELSELVPPSDIPLTRRGIAGLANPNARFSVAFNPFNEESPEMIGEIPFGFSEVEGAKGRIADPLGQTHEAMNSGSPLQMNFSYPGYGSAGGGLGTSPGDRPHSLAVYGNRNKFLGAGGSGTGQIDAIGLTQILNRAQQALYGRRKGLEGLGSAGGLLAPQYVSGPSTLEELLSGMGQQLRGETYTPATQWSTNQ